MMVRNQGDDLAAVLHLAKTAQRASIKHILVSHYVPATRVLNNWSDYYYRFSRFHASSVVNAGKAEPDPQKARHWDNTATALRHLRKLVQQGILTVYQRRKGAMHQFLFDRATCDALAAEVREELLAEGILPRRGAGI